MKITVAVLAALGTLLIAAAFAAESVRAQQPTPGNPTAVPTPTQPPVIPTPDPTQPFVLQASITLESGTYGIVEVPSGTKIEVSTVRGTCVEIVLPPSVITALATVHTAELPVISIPSSSAGPATCPAIGEDYRIRLVFPNGTYMPLESGSFRPGSGQAQWTIPAPIPPLVSGNAPSGDPQSTGGAPAAVSAPNTGTGGASGGVLPYAFAAALLSVAGITLTGGWLARRR